MKRVTSTLAKSFVCKVCVDTKEGIVEPGEEISFYDQADFVKSFCYLGDRLNASGLSELLKISNAIWERDMVSEGE